MAGTLAFSSGRGICLEEQRRRRKISSGTTNKSPLKRTRCVRKDLSKILSLEVELLRTPFLSQPSNRRLLAVCLCMLFVSQYTVSPTAFSSEVRDVNMASLFLHRSTASAFKTQGDFVWLKSAHATAVLLHRGTSMESQTTKKTTNLRAF